MNTNKTEQEIAKNQEAVRLFAEIEKISEEQPEVFQFFLSKYGTRMLDYYDWGALWRTDQAPAGVLDKFMPYIQLATMFIGFIILIVRK